MVAVIHDGSLANTVIASIMLMTCAVVPINVVAESGASQHPERCLRS